MPAPIALNIFDTGPRLWLSQRINGTWVTTEKPYDRADGLGVYAFEFGAGATAVSQVDNLGIVINGNGAGGPYFIGNSTTDPAPPVITDEYSDPHPGIWNHVNGARWINGNYYFFGRATSSSKRKVEARKSSDGVSWANQDNDNAPVLKDATSSGLLNAALHDTWWDWPNDVYCLVARPVPLNANTLSGQVFKFDTSSNSWSQVTDEFSNMANLPAGYEHIEGYVAVHSDGSIGVIYPGQGKNIFGNDINGGIKYRLWNGSAWSAEVDVVAAGGCCGAAIFQKATGTFYLFYYGNYVAQGVDGPNVEMLSISKSGAVSSVLHTFPNVTQSDGFGRGIIYGNIMMIPYDDYEDASNAIWEWDMTGPVSFTKNLLPIPAEEEVAGVPSCACVFMGPGEGGLVDTENDDTASGGGQICAAVTAAAFTPSFAEDEETSEVDGTETLEWKDEALEQ